MINKSMEMTAQDIATFALVAITVWKERVMELKAKPICGDHLTDDCVCFDYMREITKSAERLIELAKEREELSK